MSENFIGDDYHVFAATHVAWLKVVRELVEQGVQMPVLTSAGGGRGQKQPEWFEGTAGYGRGVPLGLGMVVLDDVVLEHDRRDAESLGPEAVEWVEHRHRKFKEILANTQAKPYGFMNGALFPNLGLMGFYSCLVGRHFMHFHPRGPLEQEIWQWTMVERDAPKVVKEIAVQRVYQAQHMAGTVAPDDVENLERMVEAMHAPRNWRKPFHYGLQLGHQEEGPGGVPGNLGPNPSEVNQRQFYRFWLELMERS
jgi:hypothetical protein